MSDTRTLRSRRLLATTVVASGVLLAGASLAAAADGPTRGPEAMIELPSSQQLAVTVAADAPGTGALTVALLATAAVNGGLLLVGARRRRALGVTA